MRHSCVLRMGDERRSPGFQDKVRSKSQAAALACAPPASALLPPSGRIPASATGMLTCEPRKKEQQTKSPNKSK